MAFLAGARRKRSMGQEKDEDQAAFFRLKCSILFNAISWYSGEISIPMWSRFSIMAAIQLVPAPQNGSSTISPSRLPIVIR